MRGRTAGSGPGVDAQRAQGASGGVEDDGVGMDPARLNEDLDDAHLSGAHVGLGNVDSRLRNAYGDEFGLVVETAPGAGTKVTVLVPKFAPGVHA